MLPQGKGVYEECALGLEFMLVKPHPVAMIQSPSGAYVHLPTVYILHVVSLPCTCTVRSLSCRPSSIVCLLDLRLLSTCTCTTHCSCPVVCVHNEGGALLGPHEVHLGSTHHRQAGAGQSTGTAESSTGRLESVRTLAQIWKLTWV